MIPDPRQQVIEKLDRARAYLQSILPGGYVNTQTAVNDIDEALALWPRRDGETRSRW
jgi:hypothetical protein